MLRYFQEELEPLENMELNCRESKFPLFAMSSLYLNVVDLSGEHKQIYELGIKYLEGDFFECLKASYKMVEDTKDETVYIGAYALIALCSIYMGSTSEYIYAIRKIEQVLLEGKKSHREEKDLELVIYTLKIAMLLYDYCPKWLDKGDFRNLSPCAFPHARTIFAMQRLLKKEELHFAPMMEPLCSQTEMEGVEPAALYLHLLLACCYHENGNTNEMNVHLDKAIEIAVEKKWYGPLIARRASIGIILDRKLNAIDPELSRFISRKAKIYMQGWESISMGIRGERNALSKLNLREGEIAKFAALGKRNKEIADILGISTETVRYNMSIILQKLEITKRKELKGLIFGTNFGKFGD